MERIHVQWRKRYTRDRFWSDILREKYLDVYEGIQSKILNTMRFGENTEIGTTYLGKADSPRIIKLKQWSPSPYQNKGIP